MIQLLGLSPDNHKSPAVRLRGGLLETCDFEEGLRKPRAGCVQHEEHGSYATHLGKYVSKRHALLVLHGRDPAPHSNHGEWGTIVCWY